MSRRLVVDWIKCDAHGICVELLPEMLRFDDWGYPIIDSAEVPAALMSHARRAVTACPTLALRLERIEKTESR